MRKAENWEIGKLEKRKGGKAERRESGKLGNGKAKKRNGEKEETLRILTFRFHLFQFPAFSIFRKLFLSGEWTRIVFLSTSRP